MSSLAYERIRDALETHGSRIDMRGSSFKAQCPYHEDKEPSLHVTDKGDKALVRCFSGCHTDDVLGAINLEPKDMFDEVLEPGQRAEKGGQGGQVVRSYTYHATNGDAWLIKDRLYPKSFRMRLPGTEPGDTGGTGGRPPVLYRMPQLYRAMTVPDCDIWLVDGEKDVESLEKLGAVATCSSASSGAGWREEFSSFLRSAGTVHIVVDQDTDRPNGELGAGQTYAMAARDGLRSVGVKVKMWAPAAGKDATDHIKAGYGLADFLPETTAYTRPRGLKADELMAKEFEPIKWVVEGLLPTGLCIFAGTPKAGKSWSMLDICLAVASGGQALGGAGVHHGSVMYLAREDTFRRLQDRIRLVMGGFDEAPAKLELMPDERDWAGGEAGLASLTEWAEEVGDPSLVVLDTLAKVEPEMGETGRGNAYGANYSMMSRYKNWADQHNCAVVMVHHDRKGAASAKADSTEDPFSRISGTRGLTGAADTMWFLETVRGERTGQLHVTGRDVVEQSLEMAKVGPLWTLTDMVQTI